MPYVLALESRPVKRTLTTWLLVAGLLLQSALWLVPGQRAQAAEHLAHKLLHLFDRGDHQTTDHGHHVDASLTLEEDRASPGHSHANEGVQLQGLPVTAGAPMPLLHGVAPAAGTPLALPRVPLDGLLRPPRAAA